MKARRWLLGTLFLLIAFNLASAPALGLPPAQQQPAGDEDAGAPSEEEPVEAVSDAERLIRIEEVIELDRKKLAELEADQKPRREFFDLIATGIKTFKADLKAKRVRLDEVGETGDPAERSSLEEEITKLETDLELFKTQSDLALSSLTTVRQQITALEKKIEREQRALDVLRGVAPQEPAAQPPVAAPPTTQPGAAPGLLPLMPGVPPATMTVTAGESVAPIDTTAKVEALRALQRKQFEAREAQQAVVEFVKRKRSLEQQIALEVRLLETARRSAENLIRVLETRRADLERVSAAGKNDAEVRRLRERVSLIEELIDGANREIDQRSAYLDSLNERLETLSREEVSVTEAAEVGRDAVREAQGKLRWLQSPLHPQNLIRWARERGPRILIVLVALGLLLTLVRFGIRLLLRLLVRRSHDVGSTSDRADTLSLSFRSAASFLLVVAGVFLVLQEAGVDVKTVLGGAAILGVAVAFGAQNLTRDYFTGFLILLENQFELGDLITIGKVTGTVESLNMRVTMLRDLEGRVHFVPNGEIKSVTNLTYQWSRAVLTIPVGYNENVDRVMETLMEVGRGLRADPDYADSITEDPVMLGVDAFTENGVIIKFMVKTSPEQMFTVRNELYRRVKNRFDELGIAISVPHRIILQSHKEQTPVEPRGDS